MSGRVPYLCALCGNALVERRGKVDRNGQRRCNACCRRGKHATCGYCTQATQGDRFCSPLCKELAAWYRRDDPIRVRDCAQCGHPYAAMGTTERKVTCSDECARARRRQHDRARDRQRAGQRTAHHRQQSHRRRTVKRHTDLTAEDLRALLDARTYCPLCKKRMTDDHRHPHAKHIDHIIPLIAGGTHTAGNVRVICRTCNLGRPKDGSDITQQVTLWAQDVHAVPIANKAAQERERLERVAQRQAERDARRRERHELSAGRAALALGMRLQGAAWADVAHDCGYKSNISARTAVVHHWPQADADLIAASKKRAKEQADEHAAKRLAAMQALRDAGHTWRVVADTLGYANRWSAQRCARTYRKRLAATGPSKSVVETTRPTPTVLFPPLVGNGREAV